MSAVQQYSIDGISPQQEEGRSFAVLSEGQKDQVRAKVTSFLRRHCTALLGFGLSMDDIICHPASVTARLDALIDEGKLKKGKRNIVYRRIDELQRLVRTVIDSFPPTVAAEQRSEPQEPTLPRRPLPTLEGQTETHTPSWTCEVVLPALRQLAESSLAHWDPLEDAGKETPEESAWIALIEEAKAATQSQERAGKAPSAKTHFIRLLKFLNERWFMDRGIFLTRVPIQTSMHDDEVFSPVPLWDAVRVQVSTLAAVEHYAFHDATVPVVLLRTIFPSPQEVPPTIHYDVEQGYAVLPLDAIELQDRFFAHLFAAGHQADSRMDDALICSGDTPAALASWREYARIVVPLYPDRHSLDADMLIRSRLEEVGHGVDAMRARAVMGDDMEDRYYSGFADVMLSPTGEIRTLWDRLEAEEEKVLFGKSMSELSAQMRAAALCDHPLLLLAEWRKWIVEQAHPSFDPDTVTHLAHESAASLALLLLSDELLGFPQISAEMMPEESKLPDTGSSEADTMNADEERQRAYLAALLSIADRLLQCPPEAVRLALKRIYAREFRFGVIDEPPFGAILDDGRRWMPPITPLS